MFSKHLSRLSSAYCHNELPSEDARRFAEHLIACQSCRLDFDEVKLGATLAQHLDVHSAPPAIWNSLVAGIDNQSRTFHRFHFLKPLAIAAVIVVLIAGGLWLSRNINSSSAQSWQVARLLGTPRIDSKNVSDTGKLGVGQWLEIASNSRA